MQLKKPISLGIIAIFVLSGMLGLLLVWPEEGTVQGATIYVGTGSTYVDIQDAIINSNEFDTIIVGPGEYTMNYIISKNGITLQGNSSEDCKIHQWSSGYALELDNCKNVNVTGFNISTEMPTSDAVYVNGAQYCNISGNKIFTRANDAWGVFLKNSWYNNITDNIIYTMDMNSDSLATQYSNFNNISYNRIYTVGNYAGGIFLNTESASNNLTGNVINTSGEDSDGIFASTTSWSNMIYNNTIWTDNEYSEGITLTVDTSYNTLLRNTISTSGTEAHGILVEYNSINNTVSSNYLRTYGYRSMGVYLYQVALNTTINGNNIFTEEQNSNGILIQDNSNHTLSFDNVVITMGDSADGFGIEGGLDNTIENNTMETFGRNADGIFIDTSDNCIIQDNDISTNGTEACGIYDHYTQHLRVENNTIYSDAWNSHAIASYNSDDVRAWDNNLHTIFLDSCGVRFEDTNASQLNTNNVTTEGHRAFGIHLLDGCTGNSINDNEIITYGSEGFGILIEGSNDNLADSNTIITEGPDSPGVYVDNCDYNSIRDNVIDAEGVGLLNLGGSDSIYDGNTISTGARIGMDISESQYVTFLGNIMFDCGISLSGPIAENWNTHTFDAMNTINGKPVRYLANVNDQTVPGGAGQVILASCGNVSVIGQTINNTNVGLIVGFSENSTIADNHISNNMDGILLENSKNNLLRNNTLLSHSNGGIDLIGSSMNVLERNFGSMNFAGAILVEAHNNDLTHNNFSFNNQDGIQIEFSNNNTIQDNILNNNSISAIYTMNTMENEFKDNIAKGNEFGAYLDDPDSDVFHSNRFIENTNGIRLSNPMGPLIYNNYFDNSDNWDVAGGSDVVWNISKTPGENIMGGPFLGGNYWSDYIGTDNDDDGLGDTLVPYGPGDALPLVYVPPAPDGIQLEDATNGTPYTGILYQLTVNITNRVPDNVTAYFWVDNASEQNTTMKKLVNTTLYRVNIGINIGTIGILNYRFEALYEGNITAIGPFSREIIDNVAPEADAGDDRNVTINTLVVLDATGSTDNIGIVEYNWTVFFGGQNHTLLGMEPVFNFSAVGSYPVTLAIKDAAGNTDTDTITVDVYIPPPPANQKPSSGFDHTIDDRTVTFTDTSSDPDGTIVNWTWNFGDGAMAYEQHPVHTYGNPGTYTVGLTVTDDDGATGFMNDFITIEAPTIFRLTGNINYLDGNLGSAATMVTLTGAQTYTTVTEPDDTFEITGILQGVYELKFEADGYTTKVFNDHVVNSDNSLNIDMIPAGSVLRETVFTVRPGEVASGELLDDRGNVIARIKCAGNGTLVARSLSSQLLGGLLDKIPEGMVFSGIYLEVELGELDWIYIESPYEPDELPENAIESTLCFYYYHPPSNGWSQVTNSGMDISRHVIWANVSHLTIFAALAEEEADTDEDTTGIILVIAVVVIMILLVAAAAFFFLRKKGETEDGGDEEDEFDDDEDVPDLEDGEEDSEGDDGEVEEEEDDLSAFDRSELKDFIKENELDIKITKKMSDDDIRTAIREQLGEEDENLEEEETVEEVIDSDLDQEDEEWVDPDEEEDEEVVDEDEEEVDEDEEDEDSFPNAIRGDPPDLEDQDDLQDVEDLEEE